MEALELEKIEQEIITIVKRVCEHQSVNEEINGEFCPGKFIMSQVLVSIIPEIEIKTGMTIPVECYMFHDNKSKEQLSIKNAVKKLLKVAKNEQ
jgi:hypothetical protein